MHSNVMLKLGFLCFLLVSCSRPVLIAEEMDQGNINYLYNKYTCKVPLAFEVEKSSQDIVIQTKPQSAKTDTSQVSVEIGRGFSQYLKQAQKDALRRNTSADKAPIPLSIKILQEELLFDKDIDGAIKWAILFLKTETTFAFEDSREPFVFELHAARGALPFWARMGLMIPLAPLYLFGGYSSTPSFDWNEKYGAISYALEEAVNQYIDALFHELGEEFCEG